MQAFPCCSPFRVPYQRGSTRMLLGSQTETQHSTPGTLGPSHVQPSHEWDRHGSPQPWNHTMPSNRGPTVADIFNTTWRKEPGRSPGAWWLMSPLQRDGDLVVECPEWASSSGTHLTQVHTPLPVPLPWYQVPITVGAIYHTGYRLRSPSPLCC